MERVRVLVRVRPSDSDVTSLEILPDGTSLVLYPPPSEAVLDSENDFRIQSEFQSKSRDDQSKIGVHSTPVAQNAGKLFLSPQAGVMSAIRKAVHTPKTPGRLLRMRPNLETPKAVPKTPATLARPPATPATCRVGKMKQGSRKPIWTGGMPAGRHRAVPRVFAFDHVFKDSANQQDVFAEVRPLVEDAVAGFNTCIFAYGQTGSGKTYTMMNPKKSDGIIPQSVALLFERAYAAKDSEYEIEMTFLEIYNNEVRDLLYEENSVSNRKGKTPHKTRAGTGRNVEIHERQLPVNVNDRERDIVLTGSPTLNTVVRTAEQAWKLIRKGSLGRATGVTATNPKSSRSHSVLTFHITCKEGKKDRITKGKLHLVDLAGSESLARSEAEGERQKETTKINQSLTMLGDVLHALSARNLAHIPYRNCKLTHLLSDSLGGNARTLMIATICPEVDNYRESLQALQYAQRAKTIKSAARLNSYLVDGNSKIRSMKQDIKTLKDNLRNREEELGLLKDIDEFSSEQMRLLGRTIEDLAQQNASERRRMREEMQIAFNETAIERLHSAWNALGRESEKVLATQRLARLKIKSDGMAIEYGCESLQHAEKLTCEAQTLRDRISMVNHAAAEEREQFIEKLRDMEERYEQEMKSMRDDFKKQQKARERKIEKDFASRNAELRQALEDEDVAREAAYARKIEDLDCAAEEKVHAMEQKHRAELQEAILATATASVAAHAASTGGVMAANPEVSEAIPTDPPMQDSPAKVQNDISEDKEKHEPPIPEQQYEEEPENIEECATTDNGESTVPRIPSLRVKKQLKLEKQWVDTTSQAKDAADLKAVLVSVERAIAEEEGGVKMPSPGRVERTAQSLLTPSAPDPKPKKARAAKRVLKKEQSVAPESTRPRRTRATRTRAPPPDYTDGLDDNDLDDNKDANVAAAADGHSRRRKREEDEENWPPLKRRSPVPRKKLYTKKNAVYAKPQRDSISQDLQQLLTGKPFTVPQLRDVM